MFNRSLEPVVQELLDEFRIVYVTGPRQAGKTTLVKELANRRGLRYITFDNQTILASAKNDPKAYLQSLGSDPVVLDEFQYVPEMVPAIKEISDALKAQEKGRFLLTGSADIFSSAKVQEALPGHMAKVELLPLSLAELSGQRGQKNNLIDALFTGEYPDKQGTQLDRAEIVELVLNGGFPEPQGKSTARSRQSWFSSYVDARLLKDFESLYDARGDYYSKVSALIRLLAGRSGNLLKYSNIGNELELNDKVVKTYTGILEHMFLIKRIPGYRRNRARSHVVSMPKIHFTDTGLAAHLLGLRTVQQLAESQFYGGLLESQVFLECLKQGALAREPASFYHFRDTHQQEVDIVAERANGEIIGIEVKASASVSERDFKGLHKLAEYAGSCYLRGILIYTGDQILPFKIGKNQFTALPFSYLPNFA